MSKGLEIIKKWRTQIQWNKDFGWNDELDIIETALKRLEKQDEILRIIKNYSQIKTANADGIDKKCFISLVLEDNKPEFDLLKEWLELL